MNIFSLEKKIKMLCISVVSSSKEWKTQNLVAKLEAVIFYTNTKLH